MKKQKKLTRNEQRNADYLISRELNLFMKPMFNIIPYAYHCIDDVGGSLKGLPTHTFFTLPFYDDDLALLNTLKFVYDNANAAITLNANSIVNMEQFLASAPYHNKNEITLVWRISHITETLPEADNKARALFFGISKEQSYYTIIPEQYMHIAYDSGQFLNYIIANVKFPKWGKNFMKIEKHVALTVVATHELSNNAGIIDKTNKIVTMDDIVNKFQKFQEKSSKPSDTMALTGGQSLKTQIKALVNAKSHGKPIIRAG